MNTDLANESKEKKCEKNKKSNYGISTYNLSDAKYETTNVINNKKKLDEEEARSFLRNEFLTILFAIKNHPIKIQFDKTKHPLSATFAASDHTFSTISVKNLETSLGKEPCSLLRTNDIIYINYENE